MTFTWLLMLFYSIILVFDYIYVCVNVHDLDQIQGLLTLAFVDEIV